MKKLRYFSVALLTCTLGLAGASAFGQDAEKIGKELKEKIKEGKEAKDHSARGFCSNDNWSNDKVSVNDLREMTIPAGGLINVDAGRNGGVSVKGEDRGDVLVRACIQAWGTSEETARGLASGIRISTSGVIKADGAEEKNWSVSFQLLVPRSSNLKLSARNGGISIGNVDGTAEFETLNGGVSLTGVSGDFRGKTQNGGVSVYLTGASWRGNGLDVTTMNGGVNIKMPANYAARLETSTVNGGFSTDIPGIVLPKKDEYGRRTSNRVTADLNGGGALIKVVTTNGGVRISSADGDPKRY
jgi:hypothetical protein